MNIRVNRSDFLKAIGLGAAALALLAGCAKNYFIPTADFLADNYEARRPTTVAVLPIENETTDMDAPDLVRELMTTELAENGYDTLSTNVITNALRDEGITDAGQLSAISTEELGQILDADALLYGRITTFRHFITGIYNERAVDVRFRLVDIHFNQRLWENEVRVANKQLSTEVKDIKEALISNVVGRIVEKTIRKPLLPESKQMVTTQLATLPWGSMRKGVPSWLWKNPGTKIGMSIVYGWPYIAGLQLTGWQQNIGLQASCSVLTGSLNLLYSPGSKGVKKYYGGIRVGYDRIETGSGQLGLSVLGGVELLGWKYGGRIPNKSFSLYAGYSLSGLKGILIGASSGFYIR